MKIEQNDKIKTNTNISRRKLHIIIYNSLLLLLLLHKRKKQNKTKERERERGISVIAKDRYISDNLYIHTQTVGFNSRKEI
jgi:hypothetical protein